MRPGDSDPPEGPDWRHVNHIEELFRRVWELLEDAESAVTNQEWSIVGERLQDAAAVLEDIQFTVQQITEDA